MVENSDTIEIKFINFTPYCFAYHPFKNLFNSRLYQNLQRCLIEGFKNNRDISYPTTRGVNDKNVVLKEVLLDLNVADDVDVCVVAMETTWIKPLAIATEELLWKRFKEHHPHIPVILTENEYEWKMMEAQGKKYFLRDLTPEETFIHPLCENKINESKRNQLVKEYGAVKFVRMNSQSERGIKILRDEIVYAGLGKIMDEKERRKATQKTQSLRCNLM